MKKLSVIVFGVFMSLLSNPVFGQADPGVDPDPAAPIGDHIWVLAAIGLVYVLYKVVALSPRRK